MPLLVPRDTLPEIVFGKFNRSDGGGGGGGSRGRSPPAPSSSCSPASPTKTPLLPVAQDGWEGRGNAGGKKWNHSGVDSYSEKVLRLKVLEERKNMGETELRLAFTKYKDRKATMDRRKNSTKWQVLNLFQQLVDEECRGRSHRLYGGDRALYELLFRAEPRECISRHRFLTVMRDVYGFDIAPSDHIGDLEALRILNLVYRTFDTDNCDRINWRILLFMMGVTSQAEKTFPDIMRFGFAIYSSEGSFDANCEDPIRLSDLKELVMTLVKYSCRSEVAARFEESWCEVAATDSEASRQHSLAEAHGDQGMSQLRVSLRIMNLILDQAPLSLLYRPARRYGIRDPQPWTFAIEENYYDKYVLNLLMDRRRQLRGNVLAAEFLAQAQRRVKRFYTGIWKKFCSRRAHARELTRRLLSRQLQRAIVVPFYRWRRCALVDMSAISIQAAFRRQEAMALIGYVRSLHWAAILIQCRFRGLRTRKRYLKWKYASSWAAIDIQRIVRGYQARCRTQLRLRENFDREVARVDRAVAVWEARRFVAASGVIQRAWRRLIAQKGAQEEVEGIKQLKAIEGEMGEIEKRREREEAVYKRELEVWYMHRRSEEEKNRVVEGTTKEERRKIMLYRRRGRDRERQQRLAKLRAADEALEEVRIASWQLEWDTRGEERTTALRERLAQLFVSQDTAEERALLKKIQKEIRKEAKEVINLADAQGATELEWPDAMEIAKQQVIERRIEEEREAVVQEMKAAAAKHMAEQEKLADEKKLEKSAAYQEAANSAARRLQRMYQRWKAVKEIRERAMQVYVKRFHAESGNYYWINTSMQTVLWDRPTALGSYDVEMADEWITIMGSFDLVYYYNPRNFTMSWSVPQDTAVCSICCAFFAERLCDVDKRLYCAGCYDRLHFGSDPNPDWRQLTYKLIRGGVVGANEAVEEALSNESDLESFRAWPPAEAPPPLPARIAKVADRKIKQHALEAGPAFGQIPSEARLIQDGDAPATAATATPSTIGLLENEEGMAETAAAAIDSSGEVESVSEAEPLDDAIIASYHGDEEWGTMCYSYE